MTHDPKPYSSDGNFAGLVQRFPDVAAQWHPSRNDDVDINGVSYASKIKAWWLCPECGHEWAARVGSRTRGFGCPSCGRRKAGGSHSTPKAGRSLAEQHPDIAAQWHPRLNGDLRPDAVGVSSNKRVWWLCDVCGNEWQVQIANRTRGSACRACVVAAKRRPKPGLSLEEKRPQLAAEWHPKKNMPETPRDVPYGVKRKAWWLCSACGNEWQAAVGNRSSGAGCPSCGHSPVRTDEEVAGRIAEYARRRESGVPKKRAESFRDRYPDTAAQWHPTRNGELTADQVGPASNKRAWWLCPDCGHEWDAVINSRGPGKAGCPPCGRHRAGRVLARPKPGESFAELFPHEASQWHADLNGDLRPTDVAAKSGRRVWWLCPDCQHVWEAPVYSRASGFGCKQCATRRSADLYGQPGRVYSTGRIRTSLQQRHPELAAQWHPTRNGDLTPDDVTATSGKKVWWRCEHGHEWRAYINNRVRVRGCPKCTLWGTSEEEIRLRQELLAAGVPIDLSDEVRDGSGKAMKCDMVCGAWRVIIEFDGNRFHTLPGSDSKDRRKSERLRDEGWIVIRVREALEPVGDHDVVVPLFSNEVVRAKSVLAKLHELGLHARDYAKYMEAYTPWGSATVASEIKRRYGRSLATENPELASQWDPIKNGDLTPAHVAPRSGRKVWWLCPTCGNSWNAVVGSRAQGSGCPDCGRRSSVESRKRPSPGHSLADRYPHVAAELHPTKNSGLTADAVTHASRRRLRWRGTCGHEWEDVVKRRTLRGKGCPECSTPAPD